MKVISTLPSGCYEVRSEPWEARMSHWVHPPIVLDLRTASLVYSPEDRDWSVEHAAWVSESQVRLDLWKYPGGPRTSVEVIIDCAARTARIGGNAVALAALDAALKQASR